MRDAVEAGDLALVRDLLAKGRSVESVYRNRFGEWTVPSCLTLAAGRGDLEMVKLLTEAGACVTNPRYTYDPNAPGGGGLVTPLHFTSNSCDTRCLEYLLAQGARPPKPNAEFINQVCCQS